MENSINEATTLKLEGFLDKMSIITDVLAIVGVILLFVGILLIIYRKMTGKCKKELITTILYSGLTLSMFDAIFNIVKNTNIANSTASSSFSLFDYWGYIAIIISFFVIIKCITSNND